jgi:hypothetical protein
MAQQIRIVMERGRVPPGIGRQEARTIRTRQVVDASDFDAQHCHSVAPAAGAAASR